MRARWPLVVGVLGCGQTSPVQTPTPCVDDADCEVGLRCSEGLCARPQRAPGSCANLAGASPLDPGAASFRVFAMGHRLDLDTLSTYDTLRAALDARVRSEVLAVRAREAPNWLHWPAGLGLALWFVGPEAGTARLAATLGDALARLAIESARARAFYAARFANVSPATLTGLARTDALWRGLDAVFGSLARQHTVWLSVTLPVAEATRVDDPETVAALGAAGARDVWLATRAEVYLQTVVYAPDGARFAQRAATHPGAFERDALGVVAPSVAPPRSVTLPFARVALAPGEDAWSAERRDTADRDGAALTLAAPMVRDWGLAPPDALWAPERLRAELWGPTVTAPVRSAVALSCLSGNLFDVVFDCQSSILTRAGREAREGAWVGLDARAGFAAVAPWHRDDPLAEPLDRRREALRAAARSLAPGGLRADAYTPSTVFYDVNVGALEAAASAPLAASDGVASAAISPSVSPQQNPDVTTLGDNTAFAVWEDHRDGCPLLYGARSRAGGLTGFGPARRLVGHGPEPHMPQVEARGETVFLVWQERALNDLDERVRFARSLDGGLRFETPLSFDSVSDSQTAPLLAVDRDRGEVLVAWLSAGAPRGRLRLSVSADGGRLFRAPQTLSGTERAGWRMGPGALAIDRGAGLIVWSEASAGRTELWARETLDSASTWSAPFRVDDGPEGGFVRQEGVSVEALRRGAARHFVVAWGDLRGVDATPALRLRPVVDGVPGAAQNIATDAALAAPQLVRLGDGRLRVAWQGLRGRLNHLVTVDQAPGGDTFLAPAMMGDGPRDAQQFRPREAPFSTREAQRPRWITVFVDDRSGRHQVRARWHF